MAEEQNENFRLEEARQALQAQREVDVDLLSTYPGEWVVIHQGHVVAHGPDGAEVAKMATGEKFPYSEMLYIPTLEKQAGVRILRLPSSHA